MSITNETELTGMQQVSEAVTYTLKEMKAYARAGMSTKELDDYGAKILADFGAKSAPLLTYNFRDIPVLVWVRSFATAFLQKTEFCRKEISLILMYPQS